MRSIPTAGLCFVSPPGSEENSTGGPVGAHLKAYSLSEELQIIISNTCSSNGLLLSHKGLKALAPIAGGESLMPIPTFIQHTDELFDRRGKAMVQSTS